MTDTPTVLPKHVQRFHACQECTYDFASDEGERSCHYYACPYLPVELDVRCPTCLYNFRTRDGNPGCSDEPTCDFARNVAPARLAMLEQWLTLQG